MRALICNLLSLTLLTSGVYAADNRFDPNTAKAYEAYVVTFMWPEGQSSEQVSYKNILPTDRLVRFPAPNDVAGNTLNSNQASPFGNRLGRQVKILANQKWTLIFKQPGDTINKSFVSQQNVNGYPVLTGNIAITLGRYLESDIRYQHYLFGRAQQTASTPQDKNSTPQPIAPTTASSAEVTPTSVLKLRQNNRTASKKVNYLDHPTIGTLIYFEPIELEQAISQQQ
ncbi:MULTISPECIES: CsiV family protein [Marinomonas]|uniref:CsiV family protein n=1 Tax=Marinomonas rhodophyticola TaxID=2992803 RepID=A0ABT3KHC2_9GAMM|nr:CsiV family protein [Marinomonas sp. KJ51-3]MCW4629946.1 CsiV family protein [Marinomonas sp. KJ51-3]